MLLFEVLWVGDFEDSFFFKLKFSGATSSGAESTSKSDSGELGGPFRFGDDESGKENDLALMRGLLGDDSEPVSCSVSVDILGRFVPTAEKKIKFNLNPRKLQFYGVINTRKYIT
jgi:hypothetical protein